MDFVGRHNRIGWAKTDYDRVESPSYVMRAVEEALVNAFIHRRYEIGGAEVTVFVYDDRLEITSPGSKVDGRLPEDVDLGTIESIRRNPLIADLFQRIRYMERKGSGLKPIRERTAFAPNYEEKFLPIFIDNGKNFKVVLWNMNYLTPQDAPKIPPPQVATLLDALGDEALSLAILMERLGLSDRKNFREFYLKPALESQKVEMTIPEKPTSRNQRYRTVRSRSTREPYQKDE